MTVEHTINVTPWQCVGCICLHTVHSIMNFVSYVFMTQFAYPETFSCWRSWRIYYPVLFMDRLFVLF